MVVEEIQKEKKIERRISDLEGYLDDYMWS